MAGPQRGATEDQTKSWIASPRAARTVRVLVFVIPVVAAWMAVRLVAEFFVQPPGWIGLGVWALQAVTVGAVSATLVDRISRRALPLATLMGMTLTFPDQAPSRFSIAMRTGTVRQMRKRLDELAATGLSDDTQEAAEQAIELVSLLGRHERLTRGHTERVRAYADVIAGEMHLPEHDRQMLAWGVLLHDIGKLSVPPEILNKNGRPTDEEWAILQTHPAEGARILEPLTGWLGDWALAASEHHERWDGGGYPKGLSGREISLAGRITAVADAYDVITSRRSYKEPMTAEAARQELVDGAGTQFDPAVVRAMLEVGLQRPRRVSPFGWLFELPNVARLVDSAVAAPLAAAVSVAAVASPLIAPDSPDLAREAAQTTATTPSTLDSSSSTIAGVTTTVTVPTSATTELLSPETAPTTAVTLTTAPPTTVASSATTTPTAPPTTVAPTTTTPPTTAGDACAQARSGEGNLAGADLAGCDLSGLALDGIDLSNADLTGADLRNLVLTNFNLAGANLTNARLADAQLSDGSIAGANVTRIKALGASVTRVDAAGIFGTNASFKAVRFDQVTASNANLPRVSFKDAELIGVTFTDARMTNSTFSDSEMASTTLVRADLTFADMRDADLSMSPMDQLVLSGADLRGSNFNGAFGWPVDAGPASYDDTICPNGLETDTGCW